MRWRSHRNGSGLFFLPFSPEKRNNKNTHRLPAASSRLWNIQEGSQLPMTNQNQQVMSLPINRKLLLSIREAAEYSNIAINKINEMLKQPNCSFVLFVGTKKLVKRKAFEEFIKGKVAISLQKLAEGAHFGAHRSPENLLKKSRFYGRVECHDERTFPALWKGVHADQKAEPSGTAAMASSIGYSSCTSCVMRLGSNGSVCTLCDTPMPRRQIGAEHPP
jgi:hypothetical protein